VYVHFKVIISITSFFIDNSLGPLARDSPCIKIVVKELDMAVESYVNFGFVWGKNFKHSPQLSTFVDAWNSFSVAQSVETEGQL